MYFFISLNNNFNVINIFNNVNLGLKNVCLFNPSVNLQFKIKQKNNILQTF